jgi:hypothetical protein
MSAIADGLQFGASAVAVIGAGGAAGAYGVRRWKQTVGRRRAQSAILDQLACASSLEFVESRLGVPQFVTHLDLDGREERAYRLPGAWVLVQPVAGAVRAFSITITDPEMYYDIGPMTHGCINIRLGLDTFADGPTTSDEAFEIGRRHATFVRYYDYGVQPGNQYYWLAFNGVGTGVFDHGTQYGTGIYSGTWRSGGDINEKRADPSGITANTLTVMSPAGNPNDMRDRVVHGPDFDLVLSPGDYRKLARSQKRGPRIRLRR